MATHITMNPAMLCRKMYCQHCGNKLKRNKKTKIYTPDDPEFSRLMKNLRGGIININEHQDVRYNYICPSCNIETEYDEHVKIAKKQKQLKKIILPDEENDTLP